MNSVLVIVLAILITRLVLFGHFITACTFSFIFLQISLCCCVIYWEVLLLHLVAFMWLLSAVDLHVHHTLLYERESTDRQNLSLRIWTGTET